MKKKIFVCLFVNILRNLKILKILYWEGGLAMIITYNVQDDHFWTNKPTDQVKLDIVFKYEKKLKVSLLFPSKEGVQKNLTSSAYKMFTRTGLFAKC
jgi:hypothetical protein